MNMFLVPANFVERLGWVLVHSTWQFALIALVALLLAQTARRCSAASRYWLLLLAFAAMAASPAVTLLVMPGDASIAEVAATTDPFDSKLDAALPARLPDAGPIAGADALELQTKSTRAVSWRSTIDRAVRPWLTAIVGIWLCGVVAFAWRPLLSWRTVRRLRRVGVSSAPAAVEAMLRRCSERLRLRQTVQVLQSTLTRVPVVVGFLRPVILLPVSVITCVPTSQLEAILAHELAHVSRHDFLVNLLQSLVETLFFYHPAVWWLSHRIRIERENCCDDLAVAAIGNRVEYGRALLALVELRGTATALALGARSGSLLERVRRLFGRDAAKPGMGAGSIAGVGLLPLAIVAVGVWSATQGEDDGTTPGPAVKLDGGIEIKLLGVSYQPSENQPWWTPEGAALPGDPLATRWKPGKTHVYDEGEHRELALEVRGAERDVHAWVDWAPGDKLATWSTFWNFQNDEQTSKKLTLLRAVTAGFPKGEKQRDVLVRLAVAPWTPYQVIDLKQEQPQPEENPVDGTVQLQRVHERTDGTTQVDLTFPANFELRAHHEVLGEDLSGNKLDLHGVTVSDAGARGLIFRCPLDRLAKVRVRFRWYTHEVTFRNVSLQPGHATKVKAKVIKFAPPAVASLEEVAQFADAAYTRPTADDQRATATIPLEAWGKPLNGLRAAIVLRSPPVDEKERLCYDIVAENVSDRDIRFSAELGIDIWHFYLKTKLVDAEGNESPQQAAADTFLGTRLLRFWLKPKERVVLSSWASPLVRQDEVGPPFPSPDGFSVKPGRYFLSSEMELGPGVNSVDPVSKKRTVLSPAEGEWSGKLQTGAVAVDLFTKPADKVAALRIGNADEDQRPAKTGEARVVPSTDLLIHPKRAGTMVSLKVVAGDKVKKGEVVAVLNEAGSSKPENLVAPLDGEVLKVFVREGEQVQAGQGIVRIVQLDRVVVESEMKWDGGSPRGQIRKVEVLPSGKHVFVFEGKVFIDPIAGADGKHRIRVEVENQRQDGKWLLNPGDVVKLTIDGAEKSVSDPEAEPVWGEAVDGLQLGVSGIRQDRRFKSGDTIRFRLSVRNVTAETIRFEYNPPETCDWVAPRIETANGETVKFPIMRFRGGHKHFDEMLEPNAVASIQLSGILVIGDSDAADEKWPRFEKPEPGEYRLDGQHSVQRLDPQGKPVGNSLLLTSGKVAFHVD